jgi:aryl-alcohol dehydrogenase-like predicted oxidoreductase
MMRRQLGRTAIDVSPLGLGGNIFGHFCDAAETRQIMDVALDHGLDYVDTADVYSEGFSEEFIGAAVAGRRDRWFIATKAGVRGYGEHIGLGRPEKLSEKINASLTRFGTDYVDLYQMHHFDPETPLAEMLGALDDLVVQGKARAVGVCNYSGTQLQSIADTAGHQGTTSISTAQNLYHALKKGAEDDVIPACRETGTSLIPYGVLARGILAGRYTSGGNVPAGSRAESSSNVRADMDETVLNVVAALEDFSAARGRSVAQLAIAWTLRIPEVSTALVGVRNVEQLRGLLPAGEWELSQSELSEVDKIIGNPERFDHLTLGARFGPD